MSRKRCTVIANWKMQFTFNQARSFIEQHKDEMTQLAAMFPSTSIVLCPSFETLYYTKQALLDTQIHIGAQDCSPYVSGAYTGQVSAQSLAQLGYSYCIIGHSERRRYCHESNQEIAHKLKQLLAAGIKPVVCIGESMEEYQAGKAITVLTDQLLPIVEHLKTQQSIDSILIAYEPLWAVGTGNVASAEYLADIFDWITFQTASLKNKPSLLYGGSINGDNAESLAHLSKLDGFLVGGASLDFQKFKKIVSWCSR
jgi:triosephosphate isomerase